MIIYGVYAHDRDSGSSLMDNKFYINRDQALARLEELIQKKIDYHYYFPEDYYIAEFRLV